MGGKSRAKASKEKQVLFAAEEKSLAQWIVDVNRNGYPPRKSQVREMAEDIRQQRVSKINDASMILVEYPPIGKDWVDRWLGSGLLPFNPEEVLKHIQVPLPPLEPQPVFIPLPASPTNLNSALDPALFNSSLLTSSPLNAEAFRKTAAALRNVVQEKKILATPVRQLIPRLATTTERLHAENSILKTRLKAATDVLAARKEYKKGLRVSLKDQLILTMDEAHAAATRAVEEKKMRAKRPGKRGWKRKVQEVESESKDNSSQVGSDPVLPPEILECMEV